MLPRMRKLALGIALGGLVVLSAATAGAATLVIDPLCSDVRVGDTFDVNLRIEGLDTGLDVGAWDADLLYNIPFAQSFESQILSFNGYSLGSELGFFGDSEDFSEGEVADGIIHLGELSYLLDLSLQPDAFSLATLEFTADAAGCAAFDLENIILSDQYGDEIWVVEDCGAVHVNPVPVPAAAWLLGSGLMGIVGLRRRKRS